MEDTRHEPLVASEVVLDVLIHGQSSSDEKKFNLDGSGSYSYYFNDLRTQPQIFSQHHSEAGTVMI